MPVSARTSARRRADKALKKCKRNTGLAVDRLNAAKHDFLCDLYEDILFKLAASSRLILRKYK
jgi:hypothetical protein